MADVTFNGPLKRIQVNAGITEIDVREMYSAWKDWARLSDNTKWLKALEVVGGDDIGGGQFAPIFFFLLNGWRIRPDDTSGAHTLLISTNLYSVPASADKYEEIAGVAIEVTQTSGTIVEVDSGGATSHPMQLQVGSLILTI